MALQFRFNALSGQFDLVDIAAAGAAAIPTFIDVGETFTIPVNTQALYAVPIVNDGTIVNDGQLVNVA